jgi:ABC-2 type transport system permease protein
MNLWRICKLELRQLFIEDKRRAIFLFGASLAYLLLFGLLYSTHVVNEVPLVIYDEDQTQFSRSLLQSFDDSEKFKIISYAASEEEMENSLRQKDAYAAIHIPNKFAQNAKLQLSSPVLLIANGSNILIANAVTSAAQEIIADFAGGTGTKLTETAGQLPDMAAHKTAPIQFRLRVLNNPTQSYLYFFSIGLALAAFQQGVFLSAGASLFAYREQSHLKHTNIWATYAMKLLPYWILGTLAFLLTLLAAVNLFAIPCKAPASSFVLLSAAFIYAAIGLCALITSLSSNEVAFTRVAVVYTVPAFVLSGYTWPQQSMDTFTQTLSYTFPLSYFSSTVRELMLAGHSPSLYPNSWILLLMGTIFLGIAALVFNYRNKLRFARNHNHTAAKTVVS